MIPISSVLLIVLNLFVKEMPPFSQEQLAHAYYSAGTSQIDPNKPGGPRLTLKRATEVFNEIMRRPDRAIPKDLLERAECVAIAPGMKTDGFGLGGEYGKGVTTCRTPSGNWTAPSYFTVERGSSGLQMGFKQVDMVLLIMNRKSVEKLVGDEFRVGVDATAAAGPLGRESSSEPNSRGDADILTYTRVRGLFAAVALDGEVVKQDRNSNRQFYGKEIDARSILLDSVVPVPVEARPLSASLSRLSPRKQK